MMVAAGGGNISLKVDGRRMIIKASGTDLSAVTDTLGHVTVDYQLIGEYIKKVSGNSELDEKEYGENIKKSVVGKQSFRPSIETGFHALLGPAIIHTHPVLVNAVVCCREGRRIIEKIFGRDVLWVSYAAPGLELSVEILKKIGEAQPDLEKTVCLFLENHGLIVSGPDLAECVKTTYEVNNKIREYVKNEGMKMYEHESAASIQEKGGLSKLVAAFMEDENNMRLLEGFIFPDAIVYCGCGFTANQKDASKISLSPAGLIALPDKIASSREKTIETVVTIIHTLMLAKQAGEPKFLEEKEVDIVRNMTGEKYRQKIK